MKTCRRCGVEKPAGAHVTPLSRGGFHNYANAAPAHPSCNVRKHNQLPEEVVTYR